MEPTNFDYAIIGAGAAGLQLATAMADDTFFNSKKILVLDKKSEDYITPTWCFWEKGNGKWDEIVDKSWTKTAFITSKENREIDLGSFTYKMIHGTDFFPYAQKILEKKPQFTQIEAEVKKVTEGVPNEIATSDGQTFHAMHVFDSRVDMSMFKNKIRHTYLKQHFEGWVIETEKEVFNPEVFTMMDYRLVYPETTSFTYILPVSPTKGLVEFTFFSPDLVESYTYEDYLRKYIQDILKAGKYKITKKEGGVIPMTDFPFHRFNTRYRTRIGTAGGWVKGSTGYSFKNSERKSAQVVANLKANRIPSHGLTKKRFQIYDALFLHVLYSDNANGPNLFDVMYLKNNIETIFSFLDEETNFIQEVGVMNTFDKPTFMRGIMQRFLS